MSNTEIQEVLNGNLAIAEFMMPKGNPLLNIREAKYHSSWDWLMPVVEKIEKECFASFSIGYKGTIVRCHNDSEDEIARFGEPKIKMAWLCVIEYIKWLELHPFAKPQNP